MLLELKNIRKTFPVRSGIFRRTIGQVPALRGVDLSIAAGENVSIVGESGCGKTTLARILLKLVPADSGRIVFEGHDLTDASPAAMRPHRKHMQMVFQDPFSSLDPLMMVREILKEALWADVQRKSSDHLERMGAMLSSVGLPPDTLNRFPHEFSGGERQRIAIARALMTSPKLLILDEAVSSLDVIVQQQIIDLLLDLKKRFSMSYLFISHNLRVVKKISDKIAVMYKGKIVETGPAQAIFDQPLHPYTRALLAASLDFKPAGEDFSAAIPEDASLLDQGGGHYVLEHSKQS